MEESAIIEKIAMFGFTRLEALIYLCLYTNGDLTGYEVAKQTGISRSNVYGALSGLVDHGAAYLIEGNSSKYMAVPIEEVCENHIRRMNETKKYLVENMPKEKEVSEGYVTIEGYRHIVDKIHHMLLSAEKRIYLSAPAIFIEGMEEELELLLEKGIKVVLISDKKPLNMDKGGLIFYRKTEENTGEGEQLRLIIDSTHVLTGDISDSSDDTCLYCAQKNFVNVFKEAMRNEIELIQLKGETKE